MCDLSVMAYIVFILAKMSNSVFAPRHYHQVMEPKSVLFMSETTRRKTPLLFVRRWIIMYLAGVLTFFSFRGQ